MTMRYLDFTCDTPANYLACEEALLDACESGQSGELLWCWEPRTPFVVLGYSNPIRSEVHLAACAPRGVAVVRRLSGGGAVLQAPGCLNFSLYLDLTRDACATSRGTTAFVLARHQALLAALLGRPVAVRGGDLAVENRKCSGSAQRRRQRFALFHGTFLLSLDMDLMDAVLPMPSRQPAYRQGRAHRRFLTTLPVTATRLTAALREAWDALTPVSAPSAASIQHLVNTRYAADDWLRKR